MLAADALGGVLVSGENFTGGSSLASLVNTIRTITVAAAPPCLIAADQEGGSVSHLSPVVPRLPSQNTIGLLNDPALTRRWAVAMGTALTHVGVNFDLAPVLDVRTNSENMVVHLRTFGARPEVVERHARPAIEGLLGAGVLPCVKHFPGHGDTAEDSHRGLPRVPHDVARLDRVELVPFRAVIASVPAVMLAHVVYAGLDDARPATLSRAIATGLLREHLGFTGVAVSDDLEMAAIRRVWGVTEGALQSMEAGCDLLIVAHTPGLAFECATAMATRAARDPAFRTRLEEADARVRALRERLRTPPAQPERDSVYAVAREVARRNAERGRREERGRDPTRARTS
jgi:beta-N-acetylhexosaminidase